MTSNVCVCNKSSSTYPLFSPGPPCAASRPRPKLCADSDGPRTLQLLDQRRSPQAGRGTHLARMGARSHVGCKAILGFRAGTCAAQGVFPKLVIFCIGTTQG